jgi:hypothetical protein
MCQPRKFRRKDTLEDMSPGMQTLLIHQGVHRREGPLVDGYEGGARAAWAHLPRQERQRQGLVARHGGGPPCRGCARSEAADAHRAPPPGR